MPLKLGVAGLGHGATLLQANTPAGRHLPLLVTAVCDSDGGRAQAAAERYAVPFVTTDFAELVARPELDVIGIYTPGPLHGAQILAALDAGKHVMVTKSMVYTMEEAEQVVAAVARSGRVLLVSQSLRGRLDFLEAKRACDAGEIGELFLAESHYVHDLRPVYDYSPWRVEMPQDLLLGGACHPIDLLRWFMGDIAEVHCYGLRSGLAPDYPQEDNFVVNVRFASGKIGRIAAFLGVVEPPAAAMNELTVYGTRGTLRNARKRVDGAGYLPARTSEVTFSGTLPLGHHQEMLVLMEHLADCILHGRSPWVGAREGARVVATGLACWESLRRGRPVRVRNEF